MNGRLGDEDRKNVIISEEGKMKKDVIQKYTPRFDYPAWVDIPSIEAKKNEKCRILFPGMHLDETRTKRLRKNPRNTIGEGWKEENWEQTNSK